MSHIYAWPHIVNGTVIGEIRRYVDNNGKKTDIPFYTDTAHAQGFSKGIPEAKKPLKPLGLDSFNDINEPVVICEGQKKQAAWSSLGFQCVTSILGGSNASGTDWSALKSARLIYLCPDNDLTGEKYIRALANILKDMDSEQYVVRFPDMPKKADICDWLKRQPELMAWNEYDPLTDHPKREEVLKRLMAEMMHLRKPVPAEWLVTWAEPQPIETRLLPVVPLAVSMIPEPLQAWIKDAAHRIEVLIEYPAIGALVAAGSAIGSRCGIRPRMNDDWTVYPNLWGAVIGPPGDGKSPALREAMFALDALEQDSAENAVQAQREYDAKLAIYDSLEKAVKSDMDKCAKAGASQTDMAICEEKLMQLQQPEKPSANRFVANDSTIEALVNLLKDNPRGLLMFQDELTNLLGTWEKSNHETDRSFFLQCWTGNGRYRQDRIGRGSIMADKLCISIVGGIQEDMLRRYLSSIAETKNDGLIQRFQMMVYPDPKPLNMNIIDEAPDREAKLRAMAIYRNLASMEFEQHGADGGKQPFFRFDAEAQQVYYQWETELKRKMAGEEQSFMREHLAKYKKLMPALALIFHLIGCATYRHGAVSVQNAELAAAWCDYLELHARRVYGLLRAREETAASILAEKILKGLLPERFDYRYVLHRRWQSLGRKELITEALTVLAEAGWVHRNVLPSLGNPKTEYVLHPELPRKVFGEVGEGSEGPT